MNLQHLDKRSRCALAWGTVAVFAILVYVVLLSPLISLNSGYNAKIEQDTQRLERYARLIQSAPALQAELERIRGSGLSGLFYRDITPALAATELQKKVNQLVEANRGQVVSTQVLRPERQDQFTRIGIKAQVLVDSRGMQAILKGLSDSRPVLFINTFQARVRSVGRPGATGAKAAEETEPLLDVSFDITAYMKEPGT